MFGRNWRRKNPWASVEDWQRDVFAKASRAMLESPLNGGVLKTETVASNLSITVRLNPAYPEAKNRPVVALRPSIGAFVEIICAEDRRAKFAMPDDPADISQAFQTVIAEVFGPTASAVMTPPRPQS